MVGDRCGVVEDTIFDDHFDCGAGRMHFAVTNTACLGVIVDTQHLIIVLGVGGRAHFAVTITAWRRMIVKRLGARDSMMIFVLIWLGGTLR